MADPYDAVPYESRVISQTSPPHLALCSAWHGGPLPPVHDYRALEIGCGEGTNLIALAFYSPESSFLGVDSSEGAIARARDAAGLIGLTNIAFDVRSVQDELSGLDPFHYILAHGLFSWIPADARASLLGLIRERLTPDGLGFVSYNAQPGWTARGMVRDVLLRASAVREADLRDRAARAVEVAEALLADLPEPRTAYGELLAIELQKVISSEPFYIVHEYLAEVNDAFWYREFGDLLGSAGLRHLADAQFCRPEGQVPPQVAWAVGKRGLDADEREETVDLLCNRRMRMPVVCRADSDGCDRSQGALLRDGSLASSLSVRPGPPRMMDGDTEEFVDLGSTVVEIAGAITKAAIKVLAAEWPRGIPLDQVSGKALALLKTYGVLVPGYAEQGLGDELLGLIASGHVELRLREPAYDPSVAAYPEAHALARHEAARSSALTAPHHSSWAFDEEARTLIASLDGSRTMEELARNSDEERIHQTIETVARYGLLESG